MEQWLTGAVKGVLETSRSVLGTPTERENLRLKQRVAELESNDGMVTQKLMKAGYDMEDIQKLSNMLAVIADADKEELGESKKKDASGMKSEQKKALTCADTIRDQIAQTSVDIKKLKGAKAALRELATSSVKKANAKVKAAVAKAKAKAKAKSAKKAATKAKAAAADKKAKKAQEKAKAAVKKAAKAKAKAAAKPKAKAAAKAAAKPKAKAAAKPKAK